MKPRIQKPKETYTFDYPEAIDFAERQMSVFWTPNEIKVEKDTQDILVHMSESERHGVITVLKLFTLYELHVGNEYWGGRAKRMFPRPDIQRMSNCFAFIELNVHAPFYNKINEALNLNTDEFYSSYVDDPVLKDRMDFIEEAVTDKDDLYSIGVFSLIEGAVLYSNFAFLKHFQSKGKNKLNNIVAGINFSVRDENIHSLGGAWLYKQLSKEAGRDCYEKIVDAAHKIREHEYRICDMIFEKGAIEGITDVQMKHFIDSRINTCMRNLGYNNLYEVNYNPISDWFYNGINTYVFHDFFKSTGREYNRNWSESSFTWSEL